MKTKVKAPKATAKDLCNCPTGKVRSPVGAKKCIGCWGMLAKSA